MSQVEDIEVLDGNQQEIYKIIYQIEEQSNHPLAKAELIPKTCT